MDEVVDHKRRVAAFLDQFSRERNLTLPPLSPEGTGSIHSSAG